MKKLLLTLITITGFSVVALAQTIPSYIPTTGLIGWWPFNKNANDESGNNNNGTNNGATLTTDRFGKDSSAYLFDGTSTYISIPSSASLESPTTGLTMSAWVNMSGYSLVGQTFDPIITKTNSSSDGFMYRLDIDINAAGFYAGVNNWSSNVGIAYPFNLSQWYMVSAVLDSFTAYLYLNDTLVSTQPYTTNITNNSLPLEIGRDMPGYAEIFNGKIDDVGIWNKALTQQQISGMYNSVATGIEQPVMENTMSIFPNPATNYITLHVNNHATGSTYTVFDEMGRPVLAGKLISANTIVSLSNLSAGIYMLRAGNELNQTFNIVKM